MHTMPDQVQTFLILRHIQSQLSGSFIRYATLAFLLSVVVIAYVLMRKPNNMPPGPPGNIFGDHTHLIPKEEPWKKFREWHDLYGPVISFYIGTTPVISLGSAKAASDLLDKRGVLYSGRPRSIMAGEILSDFNRGVLLQGWSKRWKNWRSLMNAGMNPTTSQEYRPLQLLESSVLIRDILQTPEVFKDHLTRYAMSIAFSIGYGRRIQSLKEDVVIQTKATDSFLGRISLPGQYIVESWPFLLWLPKCLQWFRWAADCQRMKDVKFYLSLMRTVEQNMDEGTLQPCMAVNALKKKDQFGLTRVQAAYALSSPWAGGVETTTAALDILFMALLRHPEVAKKCQDEIDGVTGMIRLPDFSDEGRMPYLRATIKEAHRWFAEAPVAFPHAVARDDIYEGMFIPKGAMVYGNNYTIFHDPNMFPEPDRFRPERFLETSDPRLINFTMMFGYGRRICPGQHIAMASQFIVLSRILAVFNVLPSKDEKGSPILPDHTRGTSGIASRPFPYPCVLVPRNAELVDVAMKEAENADEQLRGWL